ncbi:MAG: glycosyltransferase family 2 protein [Chromatiales bacterium]|nr:glycosyltransferase family 2 protein [Chromatiales bacterium]
MTLLFWAATLLIVYTYLGYPLLLRLLPGRPLTKAPGGATPTVTVLIAARNEATHVAGTIRNKLEQDYPPEHLQVIVISDDSDDGTDEIVNGMAAIDARIMLLRQSPRAGKTAALNRAVAQASGELLVFSDANSQYAPDALRQLARCFADPQVGYVTGHMVYLNPDGSLVGDGCSSYMRYENHLRRLETCTGSIVGVDGGIDAMRRTLYQPMRADQLPDFVQPLKVVSQGYRVIYCPDAVLQEEALAEAGQEFAMRVRVSLRAFSAMWDMRHLFNPVRFGRFSLQLASHKLLRYLAFLPLAGALFSSAMLAQSHLFYALAFGLQLLFYLAAAATAVGISHHNRLMGLAHYFCLTNLAAALAFLRFVRGDRVTTWTPRVG